MNQVVLKLAHHSAKFLAAKGSQKVGEVGKPVDVPVTGDNVAGIFAAEPSFHSLEELCGGINNALNNPEKIYLLILVQEYLLESIDVPGTEKMLCKLYSGLGIDQELHFRFRDFFKQDNLFNIASSGYLLISPSSAIDNEMLEGRWIDDHLPKANVLALSQLKNHLLVMFVEPIRSYVIRSINSKDRIFDQDLPDNCHFRLLQPGNELSIDGLPVITFSDIKRNFLQNNDKRELALSIDQLQYTNAKGIKEIHNFSSIESTGRLIGIVGREGVGKSTLLKLLAGKFKPGSGRITINGYDLWKNKYFLKGVIGFVPEEDLLFEELSIAENLSLTARLYYSGLTKKEIDDKVDALLGRLGLRDIKNAVAGNVNDKRIQPGQRRLVNIALELLREPQILLVDNALSGLGMSDACKVIKVLYDYSFEGNLVITSISQVDSDTFMLFDKIWILDQGGFPVYNGPVSEATEYLHKKLNLTFQCKEKADPARLLDWLDYRLPDKENQTWKRVLDPKSWHDHYLMHQTLQSEPLSGKTRLPARMLKVPNLEIQLWIFSIRNFKCKFSRLDEILKVLMIGPLFALIIAFVLRNKTGSDYSLLNNLNLPLYQFISVISVIFFGLIASIDEISRERSIIEKEEYQEFSRFSYLNSKILYLFPVIALQVTLYLITGNLILGIKELFGVYWMVLFSCACFGCLLGLLISSGMHNRDMVYKGILPSVIAILVLLGGGIIPYKQLNLGDKKYTPFIADLMVSRWGFEALAVEHFKNNTFEKLLYSTDQKIDKAAFYAFHGIPQMEQSLAICHTAENEDSIRDHLALLKHEFLRLERIPGIYKFELVDRLSEIPVNEEVAEETYGYISNYLGNHFYEQYDTMSRQKFILMGHLADSIGTGNLANLRRNYHNTALEELVTNYSNDQSLRIINNEMVRTTGMIFDEPESDWGRAPLFSPVKMFSGKVTRTLWYNIFIIWFLITFCYLWVLFDFTGFISRVVFSDNTYIPPKL